MPASPSSSCVVLRLKTQQEKQPHTHIQDLYVHMHSTAPVTPQHTFHDNTHTFVSGPQTLGPLPAQFHLESERFPFCDASGPECLLADPGQCRQLFWGNPSPHILFYSGGNAVNEEGLLGRGMWWRMEASKNSYMSPEELEADQAALSRLLNFPDSQWPH